MEVGQVPPGALITVLQKGVQYVEAEASIAEVRRSPRQALATAERTAVKMREEGCLLHQRVTNVL